MSNTNTGGPAFPSTHPHGKYEGMTLRDYFAAKAMQGMLAENGGGALINADLAVWAYQIADNMLHAREQ